MKFVIDLHNCYCSMTNFCNQFNAIQMIEFYIYSVISFFQSTKKHVRRSRRQLQTQWGYRKRSRKVSKVLLGKFFFYLWKWNHSYFCIKVILPICLKHLLGLKRWKIIFPKFIRFCWKQNLIYYVVKNINVVKNKEESNVLEFCHLFGVWWCNSILFLIQIKR